MVLSGAVQCRFAFFPFSNVSMQQTFKLKQKRRSWQTCRTGGRASALEPSCGPAHSAHPAWVTGAQGYGEGCHRQGTASFSPPSHPSSCAQLRDSPEDSSAPLSFSCSSGGQDFSLPCEKEPSQQLSCSNVNSCWPWSFTKTCAVTELWTGGSLLPMGSNNKH